MKIYNILMGWEEFSGISIPSEIVSSGSQSTGFLGGHTRFLGESRKILEAYENGTLDHSWSVLID